jgi:hypothetical protein
MIEDRGADHGDGGARKVEARLVLHVKYFVNAVDP